MQQLQQGKALLRHHFRTTYIVSYLHGAVRRNILTHVQKAHFGAVHFNLKKNFSLSQQLNDDKR